MSENTSPGEISVNEVHVTYEKPSCGKKQDLNTVFILTEEELNNEQLLSNEEESFSVEALEDDQYGMNDAELDNMIAEMYGNDPTLEESTPTAPVSQSTSQRSIKDKPIWLRKYLRGKYTKKRIKQENPTAMNLPPESNSTPIWKRYRARQAIRNNARRRNETSTSSSTSAQSANKQ